MTDIKPDLVEFAVVSPVRHNGTHYHVGDSVEMSEADAASLLALAQPPIARTTTESAASSTDDKGDTDVGHLTAASSQQLDSSLSDGKDGGGSKDAAVVAEVAADNAQGTEASAGEAKPKGAAKAKKGS